jgi:hypothetical protein
MFTVNPIGKHLLGITIDLQQAGKAMSGTPWQGESHKIYD